MNTFNKKNSKVYHMIFDFIRVRWEITGKYMQVLFGNIFSFTLKGQQWFCPIKEWDKIRIQI